jgi:hypothetical protein
MISLFATLGTLRCRDSGDIERNGGLEDVEAGVGVAEVDGGLKRDPFPETDGTLGLTAAMNLAFCKVDDGESRDSGDSEPTQRGAGGHSPQRREELWVRSYLAVSH